MLQSTSPQASNLSLPGVGFEFSVGLYMFLHVVDPVQLMGGTKRGVFAEVQSIWSCRKYRNDVYGQSDD